MPSLSCSELYNFYFDKTMMTKNKTTALMEIIKVYIYLKI